MGMEDLSIDELTTPVSFRWTVPLRSMSIPTYAQRLNIFGS
jgi:hypothetical protein